MYARFILMYIIHTSSSSSSASSNVVAKFAVVMLKSCVWLFDFHGNIRKEVISIWHMKCKHAINLLCLALSLFGNPCTHTPKHTDTRSGIVHKHNTCAKSYLRCLAPFFHHVLCSHHQIMLLRKKKKIWFTLLCAHIQLQLSIFMRSLIRNIKTKCFLWSTYIRTYWPFHVEYKML